MVKGAVYRRGSTVLWATCLCVQLLACGAVVAEPSGQISQQVLVTQIEAGTAPFILDVRTAEEYAAGHIPGAVNIHFRDIDERLDEIPQGGPIVVYCERGIRANVAEKILQDAGGISVLHLEGDMSAWRRNDLPEEQVPSELEAVNQLQSLEQRWIIGAPEAKVLLDQGATLLDTRKLALTRLEGAVYVDWRQFSPQEASLRGRLLEDSAVLSQKLQALGVSTQKPVVVFANPPSGWGEDGRIVWMLRTLGHSHAVMVDGGFDALVAAHVPVQQGKRDSVVPGNFVVARNSAWEIQREELRAQLGQGNMVVIDSREAREFAGKTPYGEMRGGHVPGAINLHFKEFLGRDGQLLPPQEIREKLKDAGITADTQVFVYCTGGIRSGWLASVLVTLGYQAKNYAGSMWEWSALPGTNYPLVML